jgi:hypothetical protein
MRVELRCAWCGCKVNPRHVTRSVWGQILCARRSIFAEPRCADILTSESIEADRNPPRPVTVYVPCD